MVTLHHHPLCPQSRFVRLFLGEYGIDPELIEERPFERKHEFLLLDPAGETPVLVEDNGMVVPGSAVIAEYFDETRGLALEWRADVKLRHGLLRGSERADALRNLRGNIDLGARLVSNASMVVWRTQAHAHKAAVLRIVAHDGRRYQSDGGFW